MDRIAVEFTNATIIVCGDFNDLDPEEIVNSTTLSILATGPTRGDKTIDFVLTNHPLLFKQPEIIDASLPTDHRGILCRPVEQEKAIRTYAYFRDQNKANMQYFNYLMDTADLDHIFDIGDPDLATDELLKFIRWTLDIACPMKRVRMSSKDPEYISPLVKYLIKKKAKASIRHNTRKINALNERIRSIILENIRASKNKRGSSAWWRQVDKHLGKKSRNEQIIDFSCEEINAFFASISTISNYCPPVKVNVEGSSLPQLTVNQVYQGLLNIKKTAAGYEEIPHWVYRQNAHNLALPLLHIFNRCIEIGLYPSVFKIAKITALPKVRNVKSLDQLRPISVTPILSRCFERLIMDHFISETYNSWLEKNQFGYRKKSSTEFAVVKLLHDIEEFDRQHFDAARLFSLDLSKAFDCVPHDLIIRQLKDMCPKINPYIINLVISFLADRVQYVHYRGENSSIKRTNCGVPQGTVKGPILFNIAYSDLKKSRPHSNITKFADDINPCVGVSLSVDTSAEVVDDILTWCSINHFRVNNEKSKELRILFSNRAHCFQNVHGIPSVEEITILGITFSARLSFEKHIQKSVKRASSNVYLLGKLQSMGYSKAELQLLYKTLVLPIITYGCLAWGGAPKKILQKIDAVQKRAVKIGAIEEFEPILDIIDRTDAKVYAEIEANQNHILKDIIPERSAYASTTLRPRKPCCESKRQIFRRIFPQRYLLKGTTS